MMGMSDFSYWLSWFCYYQLLNTSIAVISTLVLSINVFPNSQYSWIFLSIWLYGSALFGEVLTFQALIQKSKFAGIQAACFYFLLCGLYLVVEATGISYHIENKMQVIP